MKTFISNGFEEFCEGLICSSTVAVKIYKSRLVFFSSPRLNKNERNE
jgi:hypothetical protein